MTGGVAGSWDHSHDVRRVTMALQLNHVHLKTRDPEKTAQFYVETLGAQDRREGWH